MGLLEVALDPATVVVAVEQRRVHRIYHKPMRQVTRFKVHDENSLCHEGDLVRIQEARPLSKEKRWRVVEVVEKGTVALLPDDQEATASSR